MLISPTNALIFISCLFDECARTVRSSINSARAKRICETENEQIDESIVNLAARENCVRGLLEVFAPVSVCLCVCVRVRVVTTDTHLHIDTHSDIRTHTGTQRYRHTRTHRNTDIDTQTHTDTNKLAH